MARAVIDPVKRSCSVHGTEYIEESYDGCYYDERYGDTDVHILNCGHPDCDAVGKWI